MATAKSDACAEGLADQDADLEEKTLFCFGEPGRRIQARAGGTTVHYVFETKARFCRITTSLYFYLSCQVRSQYAHRDTIAESKCASR
jgi:hypothetical protein